ncbi:MAG: hypothetical protein KAG26_01160, partial [Methylococcales bacterium]|nr:hypothetical protein [Methylococcales bacterium]
ICLAKVLLGKMSINLKGQAEHDSKHSQAGAWEQEIVQGSTETTFYVLAVYFGAVGIKNIRHVATCGVRHLGDHCGNVLVFGFWFLVNGL